MTDQVRPLRWPEDRAALFEHFQQTHTAEDSELLTAWYGTLPDFDPRNSLVIADNNGEVAAHIMLIPRQLQIGASTLPTAELTLISVPPETQAPAMLRALFQSAHERMTERGDALGLLLGPPDSGYWSSEGQDVWQYEYAVGLYLTSFESEIATEALLKAGQWDPIHSYQRRTAERLGIAHQPVTVRRYYNSDLSAIAALYTAASARGHYLIARSDEVWEWQLDYLARIGRYEPDDFLVAEIAGKIVAYTRLVSQGPVNWFRERDAASFCVVETAGDHPDGVEALVAAIGHNARMLGADRIGLYIHPESALMAHALVRGACLRTSTGAGMVRVHDLAEALDRLRPALEERRLNSPYAARAFQLVLRTENDQGEVYLGAGNEYELVELEAPSTVVARLITGWNGLDRASAGYHERYAPLLRALFPQGDPKIALPDLL